MIKIIKLLIFSLFLFGCSKKQEPILLVCDGIETTYEIVDGKKIDPDIKNVKRTFNFYQDKRNIKTGILNFEDKNNSQLKEENKLVWIFSVDNGAEIFDEETYTNLSNKTLSKKTYISVSDTELFSSETNSSEYNDETKLGLWEDYSLSVNRISGDFHERKLENFKRGTSFQITTEGNCKKVDKKF